MVVDWEHIRYVQAKEDREDIRCFVIVEGIILGVPGPNVSTDQLVQYLGSSLQMDYREETKPYESSVQSSSLIREKHVPNIHGISEPSCCYTGSLMCLLKDQRPFLAPNPLQRFGAPIPRHQQTHPNSAYRYLVS